MDIKNIINKQEENIGEKTSLSTSTNVLSLLFLSAVIGNRYSVKPDRLSVAFEKRCPSVMFIDEIDDIRNDSNKHVIDTAIHLRILHLLGKILSPMNQGGDCTAKPKKPFSTINDTKHRRAINPIPHQQLYQYRMPFFLNKNRPQRAVDVVARVLSNATQQESEAKLGSPR